jgi:hypothetical protein
MLTCPACGFRSLSGEYYGSYQLCPVCDWEDDAVQLANPCSEGGANKLSLCEYQKLVESKNVPIGYDRDPAWRRLNEQETAYFKNAKTDDHWSFSGETSPHLAYWIKNDARA